MGDSEGLVDQEALESSNANEEVSNVQEEKPISEINEESNNESNEPQEGGAPGEEEKGESVEVTTADNEAQEQPQNPDQQLGAPVSQNSTATVKRHSQSIQRRPSSIARRPSQQVKSHTAPTNVVSDGRPMINSRTGKEMQSSIAQTSSVWERIPLAKILCPSWTAGQVNEVVDWELMDANEVVMHTEGCQPIVEEESQNGDEPPSETESKQVAEETESQYDRSPPPEEEESGPKDQPAEEQLSQHNDQQSVGQKDTTETKTEEDAVRISQKTGKKVRDNMIQTSRIWEKKPLAQILPHSGNKAPCPDSTQKPVDQDPFFNWPDPFEF